jgi:hypothetical protein
MCHYNFEKTLCTKRDWYFVKKVWWSIVESFCKGQNGGKVGNFNASNFNYKSVRKRIKVVQQKGTLLTCNSIMCRYNFGKTFCMIRNWYIL